MFNFALFAGETIGQGFGGEAERDARFTLDEGLNSLFSAVVRELRTVFVLERHLPATVRNFDHVEVVLGIVILPLRAYAAALQEHAVRRVRCAKTAGAGNGEERFHVMTPKRCGVTKPGRVGFPAGLRWNLKRLGLPENRAVVPATGSAKAKSSR